MKNAVLIALLVALTVLGALALERLIEDAHDPIVSMAAIARGEEKICLRMTEADRRCVLDVIRELEQRVQEMENRER